MKTVPDYPDWFLDTLAKEYEVREYGDVTAKAIDDFTVMIGG